MNEYINKIMDAVSKMKPYDFLKYEDFGRNGNVLLTITMDDDHDIRYYVEPWYEKDECYVTDWDGSDYYQMTDNPYATEYLRKDLEMVWEDSGDEILNNLY